MYVELTWNLRFGMSDATPSKLNVYTLFPVMLITMFSTETTTAVDCMLMRTKSKLSFFRIVQIIHYILLKLQCSIYNIIHICIFYHKISVTLDTYYGIMYVFMYADTYVHVCMYA